MRSDIEFVGGIERVPPESGVDRVQLQRIETWIHEYDAGISGSQGALSESILILTLVLICMFGFTKITHMMTVPNVK
jgi:hypothetical protein